MLLNSEGTISLTSINTVGIYSQEEMLFYNLLKIILDWEMPTASESVVLGDTFLDDSC